MEAHPTHNVSLELQDRVARGDYEVDAHVVAEAMMRRFLRPRRSSVLVAGEPPHGLSAGTHELEPRAAVDLA